MTDAATLIIKEGSSPLARGPPWRYRGVLYDPGLIPARAGTTGG